MRKGNDEKAQKKVIADFCSMTGASQKQAETFLKKTNWNIQNAINTFFDEGTIPEKKQLKQTKEIDALFDSLSKPDEKTKIKQIDEQRFAEFVDQYLKVEAQNLVIGHILINIMKVPKSGHITQEHFYNLFQYLGQISKQNQLLIAQESNKRQIYQDKGHFKNMYMGTYQFYLIGKEMTMEYETAVAIWGLYLKKVMPIYDKFIEYCENCVKKPKKVHKDLWKMVYEFATTVNDINQVKQDDGWPVFLDEFVEYCKGPQTN